MKFKCVQQCGMSHPCNSTRLNLCMEGGGGEWGGEEVRGEERRGQAVSGRGRGNGRGRGEWGGR